MLRRCYGKRKQDVAFGHTKVVGTTCGCADTTR
jgi:hypothetical protein